VPKKPQLDLSTFDGQLLDGLDFCRKVYDQVTSGPDGIGRIRLRPTKLEKRLIEETLPITCYVQARYRVGRRLKVRWLSGSQPYDAILWSSGSLVEHRQAPRRLFIEVTTAVHQNEYLLRQLIHQQRGAFGVKGIFRDKKTSVIISEARAYDGAELPSDLAAQIIDRLKTVRDGNRFLPRISQRVP
jgi:hypothetical protein